MVVRTRATVLLIAAAIACGIRLGIDARDCATKAESAEFILMVKPAT
jgi:hypothetical protein